MFYTYYHGCHGNIFVPNNLCKKKNFQIKPIFFILFLKQECKKNIRNVHKMLYIYYHGCYGNIFFSKFFWEI